MPDPHNAQAVLRALHNFGAPLNDLSAEDLCRDDTIFQIGVAPRRIDIITGATGLDFEPAFDRSVEVTVDKTVLRVPCIEDLIQNKKVTGRLKDLADVEALEAILSSDKT